MPVKVQADLPVKEILESENIFVMDETRAVHQDIRPLKIMILNLMPLKEDTELQLLRSLSNTSLQVDVTFLMVASHEAKNTSTSHLNTFYVKFEDVRKNYYDGMIITGAPVEQMEFEEVDYWDELIKIMDWTNTHVTSTMFLCWGAQASLYHFYGLKKRMLPERNSGCSGTKSTTARSRLCEASMTSFGTAFPPHRSTDRRYPCLQRCHDSTQSPTKPDSILAWRKTGRKIFVTGSSRSTTV